MGDTTTPVNRYNEAYDTVTAKGIYVAISVICLVAGPLSFRLGYTDSFLATLIFCAGMAFGVLASVVWKIVQVWRYLQHIDSRLSTIEQALKVPQTLNELLTSKTTKDDERRSG